MSMNKPSPRLAILRAQLADKAADESFARALYSYSAQNPRTLRALPPLADSLPLPPSYWDDLEHWLKTLAPAKPAAPQPCKAPAASGWRLGSDVPEHERVGLWHVQIYCGGGSPARQAHTLRFDSTSSYRPAAPGTKEGDPYDESKYTTAEPAADVWHPEAPSVPGVYIACHANQTERPHHYAHWSASGWTITYCTSEKAATSRIMSDEDDFLWLRLIEADAPAARLASTSSAVDGAALIGFDRSAAPGVAKLTHSVCIKAHNYASFVDYPVGAVIPVCHESIPIYRQCWLPCDKDGFIPHTPTADSVCPVPAGVHFETLLFGGAAWLRPDRTVDGGYGGTGDCNCIKWDAGTSVIAWRPIAKDAS